MQELMLIMGGGPSGDAAVGRDVGDGVGLRWREAAPPRQGWRAALAARLGLAAAAALPAAEFVARGQRAGRSDAAPLPECWLITPVHLVAGLDRVFLSADGLVELPAPQWQRLCEDFERELGGGRLRLRPVDGGAALLEGADFGAMRTQPPDCGLGRDLRALQPEGSGAARWRALQGEIEMWLHAQPLNRARAARGERTVTAFWLWGGPATEAPAPATSAAPAVASAPSATAAGWRLAGADPWLAALARQWPNAAHGAADSLEQLVGATADSGAQLAGAVAWLPQGRASAALATSWLEPAQRALAAGSIGRLTLWTRSAAWSVTRRDAWQFWRRARRWEEVTRVSDD